MMGVLGMIGACLDLTRFHTLTSQFEVQFPTGYKADHKLTTSYTQMILL